MICADPLARIQEFQNRLECVLDAVFEVAHATLLSAYSRVVAHGRDSSTRLPARWSLRSSRSTSAGRMRNKRHLAVDGAAMPVAGSESFGDVVTMARRGTPSVAD